MKRSKEGRKEGKTKRRNGQRKKEGSKGPMEDRKSNARIVEPVAHAAQMPRALGGATTNLLWL
jgi:hypothetical protein